MRTIFIMLSIMFLSAACSLQNASTTMDSLRLVQTGVQLANTYENISELVREKQDRFTDEEQATLVVIDNNLAKTMGTVQGWAEGKVDSTPVNLSSIELLYVDAKENYLLAKEIISSRPDLFSSGGMMMLQAYDMEAIELDRRMELIKSRPGLVDKGRVIYDILDMSISLGKVLTPLIKRI